jgi:hypothetical protein
MRVPLDFRKVFQTVDFSQHEAIGACLWDRQTYTSASTTQMLFFQTVRTNKVDGNIQIASQLPAGIFFLVQAIRIFPVIRPDQRVALAAGAEGVPVSVADDLAQLYNDSVFSLAILNKIYAEYPAFLLMPGAGIVANNATLTTTAQASNYIVTPTVGNPDNRAVFTLSQPIGIPPLTTIQARLDWAAAKTLEAGNMVLQTILDGQLIRPKQ